MDEETQAMNDLLGVDTPLEAPVATKPAPTEEAPPKEDDDTQSDSEEESTTEEESEETDDDDESEEESTELSEPAKLTRALRSEREERKADREKFRLALEQYQTMLKDPDFLASQYDKLQVEKDNPAPVQADIPDAPAYPNTPYGLSKMEADQVLATSILPEALSNETLQIMVRSLVSNRNRPMTYVEAAEKVRDTLGLKAETFRKEGKKATEAVVAKRTKMSTETKPRVGTTSSKQSLEKRMSSPDRRIRETSIAESLGLI